MNTPTNIENLVYALDVQGVCVLPIAEGEPLSKGLVCKRGIDSVASVLVTENSPYDFDDTIQTMRDILADIDMVEG